jgi:hypothetical protein
MSGDEGGMTWDEENRRGFAWLGVMREHAVSGCRAAW